MRPQKSIITMVLVWILGPVLIAKGQKFTLRPNIVFDGVAYLDVHQGTNPNIVWACGGLGALVKTTDGGKSWVDISPYKQKRSSVAIKKVIFAPDNQTGWIVGKVGSVYKTRNGGLTWKKVFVKTRNDIIDVHFIDSRYQNVRILTSDSEVFESDGEDKAWKKFDTHYLAKGLFQTPNRFGYFGDGSIMSIVGGKGEKEVDMALNIDDELDYPNIKGVFQHPGSNMAIATSQYGYFFISNNWQSWVKKSQIKGLEEPYSICSDRTYKSIYIIGDYSKLYKSDNGGESWIQVFNLNNNGTDLYSISCDHLGKNIWICGTNRTLINSDDFGKTWHFRSGTQTKTITLSKNESISVINSPINETLFNNSENNLYCVGNRGFMSETDFKTLSSNKLTPDTLGKDLLGIFYDSNARDIFAVGESETIIKYSLNINKLSFLNFTNSKISLKAIDFDKDRNVGIAVGEQATVLISRDQGKTWKYDPYFEQIFTSLQDVHILKNTVYILGDQGILYKSTDFAKSWTKQLVADTVSRLTSIDFSKNHKIGFITTNSGLCSKKLFSTTDYGLTWSEVGDFPNTDFRNLQRVKFNPSNDDVYITDTYGGIYKSNDLGKSWFKITPWHTYAELRSITFDSNSNPIISGVDGTLYLSNKRDFLPKIDEFSIKRTFIQNKLTPKIKIVDAEEKELQCKLSIVEPLADGADISLANQSFSIEQASKIRSYPNSIFNSGKTYTFRLTVFDGWNIITKDLTLKIGASKWDEFKIMMYWGSNFTLENIPKAIAINLTLATVLYAIAVIIIYTFSPVHFISINEFISGSNIPMPSFLPDFLMLYLITSNRSLDAFVKIYRQRAVTLFFSSAEVSSRSNWTPAPFRIDSVDEVLSPESKLNSTLYVAGLTEIKKRLRETRIFIEIEGPGGIGKTSLAIQIAKWAFERDPDQRLLPHCCLPIYIDKLGDKNLDEVILNKVQLVTDNRCHSNHLFLALLRKKRILVVIDGVSEMDVTTKDQLDPEFGAANTHLAVFTSRKSIGVLESTSIIPFGLRLEYLDMLLDGFTRSYVGAYRFGEEREILRNRIKFLISELNGGDTSRPVPLSILKQIIKQASDIIENNKNLVEELPESIEQLYDNYLSDLFRKNRDSDRLVQELRKVALISVGLKNIVQNDKVNLKGHNVKPIWVAETHFTSVVSAQDVSLFISNGLLNITGDIGDRLLKFRHDPVAEYLAAKEILSMYRDKEIGISLLRSIVKSSSSVSFESLFMMMVRKAKLTL